MAIDRRDFLKSSVASSLALATPRILRAGSGGKYRTALIGSGWWGMNIARAALQSGECKIVAMCDVDSNQLDPAVKEIENFNAAEIKVIWEKMKGKLVSPYEATDLHDVILFRHSS